MSRWHAAWRSDCSSDSIQMLCQINCVWWRTEILFTWTRKNIQRSVALFYFFISRLKYVCKQVYLVWSFTATYPSDTKSHPLSHGSRSLNRSLCLGLPARTKSKPLVSCILKWQLPWGSNISKSNTSNRRSRRVLQTEFKTGKHQLVMFNKWVLLCQE